MVLFRDACAMFDQSPFLKKRVSKRGGDEHPQNLMHRASRSFFRPVSPEGAHSGPRPHMAILDELHEHKNRNIYEMLKRGFKFRRQPLMLMITNSGYDRKTLCWEKHVFATKVAKGEVENDEFFSYVTDLDENDDPFENEDCWIKVNPLLGVTIQPEYLRGVVRDALQQPGEASNIKRLHFCIWTDSDKGWLTWKAVQPCIHQFDPFVLHKDAEVSVGLDLGETLDMTAVAGVVKTGEVEVERVEKDGSSIVVTEPTFDAWIEAWTPLQTAKARAQVDQADYPLWIEQGHLFGSPGPRTKLPLIVKRLLTWKDTFRLRGLAYDRYAFNTFDELCEEMSLSIPAYEHPQGGKRKAYLPEDDVPGNRTRFDTVHTEDGSARVDKNRPALWMPNSKRLFESAVMDGRIRLRENPVLTSAILSAAVTGDDWENQWLSKQKSTQRIDAVVALVMALGLAYVRVPEGRGSSYISHSEMIVV
jgi:phage terminase large subunit-like protein